MSAQHTWSGIGGAKRIVSTQHLEMGSVILCQVTVKWRQLYWQERATRDGTSTRCFASGIV